jgi:hypothetical protein
MQYTPLHPTKYKPSFFLLEENIADEFFNSFADPELKVIFDAAGSAGKNEIRKKIGTLMLLGDPHNYLLRKTNCSSVLEIPCITRRKRNGRIVERLKYDFDAKQLYYGQTTGEETHDRSDSLETRVAKLEGSEHEKTMVIKTVGVLTRSMKTSIDELTARVVAVEQMSTKMDAMRDRIYNVEKYLKKRIDATDEIVRTLETKSKRTPGKRVRRWNVVSPVEKREVLQNFAINVGSKWCGGVDRESGNFHMFLVLPAGNKMRERTLRNKIGCGASTQFEAVDSTHFRRNYQIYFDKIKSASEPDTFDYKN